MHSAASNTISSFSRSAYSETSTRVSYKLDTKFLKDSNNYVGFGNFPNQVFRRAVRQGFQFTIMVVGCSGLGKSTFLNSLFSSEIIDSELPSVDSILPTTEIREKIFCLTENGVTLNLKLVDTPGFGDAIDNSRCCEPIIDYIERKYQQYFVEETKIERSALVQDDRVHLCLYFIPPTGHGLRMLDIEAMKKLDELVNVIPIIGKADTLTPDELKQFKAKIMYDIEFNQIKTYQFPEILDDDEKKGFGPLRERIPFAVIGSNQVKEVAGRRTRVREYPWGTAEVENLKHNDFLAARNLIIRAHLVDLIAFTRIIHYENYRLRQLNRGLKTDVDDKDILTQIELKRKEKEKSLNEKRILMEKKFMEKVQEREVKLGTKQKDLDDQESEYKRLLSERRFELDRLMKEVVELRKLSSSTLSRQESRSSTSRTEASLPEKQKSWKSLGFLRSN